MGCVFPLWEIITIALGSVVIIIVAVALIRKWGTIKFFMFMHFDVLPNDDGPENVNDLEFDAYVTYR